MIIINLDNCKLISLSEDVVKKICLWKYEKPYNIYDLNKNNYLQERYSWGEEQFALVDDNEIIAYVACQIIQEYMWVGWSLRPNLCGIGIGKDITIKCINELIRSKDYQNKYIFLKVTDWNTRAIKTYMRLGFVSCDKFTRVENENSINYLIMRKEIK
ncbi:MAG: GNAT family N-acetyltransferase [Paraclostridium sp.]